MTQPLVKETLTLRLHQLSQGLIQLIWNKIRLPVKKAHLRCNKQSTYKANQHGSLKALRKKRAKRKPELLRRAAENDPIQTLKHLPPRASWWP